VNGLPDQQVVLILDHIHMWPRQPEGVIPRHRASRRLHWPLAGGDR
jgi:hypothetical protein